MLPRIAFLLSLILSSLLLFEGTLCDELRITSISKFIEFSKNVNSGTDYSGTTVYLNSDITFTDELSRQFEPIGKYSSKYFLGTFDGQGYTISNLKIDSRLKYVGLFGYSEGASIRNVMIGSSCSATSSYTSTSDNSYIGGIIGYCLSSSNSCIIENNVNMGNVSFRGSINSRTLYLGGVVGRLPYSSYHVIKVKNCANYGTVSHVGTSWSAYLGGIVGYSVGSSSKATYIQNCLNYGTLLNNNTGSGTQYIGGIIGYIRYINVENCVNSGEIVSKYSSSYNGGIAGYSDYSQISYCYWDKDITENVYGYKYSNLIENGSSFNSTTLELSGAVSVGSYTGKSLIAALNAAADYYALRDYSHWAINKDMSSVSFTVKGRTSPMLTVNSKIILLPSLANKGTLWFDGWYSNSECTTPLSSPYEIASDALYGKWGENTNSYTISFDTRGGTPIEPITSQFGTVVTLPTSTSRDNCTFAWWENDYGDKVSNDFTVSAHSPTIHAVWKCTVIATPADLIDFSKVVNSGSTYAGTTLYLDSDITFTDELSQQFEPIGKDDSNYFLGTFDGQGYTINNLVMDSSSRYVGLFGYSQAVTIRDVVIDSSCSVTSSYISTSSDDGYKCVGGIIGYCYPSAGSCIIESNVNIGSISFNGNINSCLYLGGVVGYLSYYYHVIKVKNCANYGTVSHVGTSWSAYLGGIVGYSVGTSSQIAYILNCLNFGALLNNYTGTSTQYIGGIAGHIRYTNVENCVNSGEIVSKYSSDYTGGITGYSDYSQVSYCYWNKDITENVYKSSSLIENSFSFNSTTLELSGAVSVGSYTGKSLIAALNAAADYYALRDYSHWALNKNGNSVSFTVKGRSSPMFTIDSKIILLPSLANKGTLWFDGWYSNSECTTPLSSPYEISSNALYGKWGENTNSYTISFNTRGGTPIDPITSQFGTVVSLPTSTSRDNCTFAWWKNDYGDRVSSRFIVLAHRPTLHAVWKCTVIATVSDFMDFSKVVNSGTDYSGTTLYLDSDITFTDELSQQFEPIGRDYSNHFRGTFDGQGYTISNLKIDSSSQYSGLFGYSRRIIIKNVVIDSSCSVTSYNDVDYEYIGGIIGYCYSYSELCIIENNVNMGSVFFNENIDKLYLGGIVGYLCYSDYETIVKNCANYGFVVHSGETNYGYIGGVVGYSYGTSSTEYVVVQNSLNYGSILYSGTFSKGLYIGGVVGYSRYYTAVENSVSAGKIPPSTTSTTSIGTIVGEAYFDTSITHCLWTSDVGYDEVNGTGSPIITISSVVELNITTINELNEYAKKKDSTWSKWVMLHLNGGGIANISIDTLVGLVKSLPIPVKEEYVFTFWCTDAECSDGKYNSQTTDISKVSDLYAQWAINNFTVTFNFNNGTNHSVWLPFNSIIEYPDNPEREWYVFNGWVPNPERMPAENITINAQWSMINTSEYVEIVFSKVDLTEDDVKDIIQGYTNDGFTIEKFEVDEKTGEITVIIKFKDTERAKNFIANVNASKDSKKNYISKVSFAANYVPSTSHGLNLLYLLYYAL